MEILILFLWPTVKNGTTQVARRGRQKHLILYFYRCNLQSTSNWQKDCKNLMRTSNLTLGVQIKYRSG